MTTLWLALVLAGTGASAWDPPELSPRGTAFEVPSDPGAWQVIEVAADRFAAHWARGELQALSGLLSSEGLVLHLERAGNTPLPRRRALAALRDFLRGYETVAVEVLRVVDTGGSPPKGFAEIRWLAVPAGTSEAVSAALFVGFLREEAGWRVSEIRVLR